jgi:hypothetical protein
VRGQQKIFDTTRWWDYPVAFVVAAVLSAVGGYFVSLIGLFSLLLAPVVGIGIAEAVRFVVRRRRSRSLPMVVTIAAILGGLWRLLSVLFVLIAYIAIPGSGGQAILSLLMSMIWPAAYAIIVGSTVFYRLKGIKL